MHTPGDEGFHEALADTSHVIMSDGLDIDLGEPRSFTQLLHIGDSGYVCSVKRIKASRVDSRLVWEFDVDTPGLGLKDLLQSNDLVLQYDDEKFSLSDEYEINLPDIASTLITFRGRRIVNNHE
jgi:hypothetical protein